MKDPLASSLLRQPSSVNNSRRIARFVSACSACAVLWLIVFQGVRGAGSEPASVDRAPTAMTAAVVRQQPCPPPCPPTPTPEPTVNTPCPAVPTISTQLGILSTPCQLTGPTFTSTTQQTNPFSAHNFCLQVANILPSGQPLPPNGQNITNHHASFNSACNLNTEGVTNPIAAIGDNRKVCRPRNRIVGTDLGIPVEFGNDLYLLFGDTSPSDATPSADLSNIVVAKAAPRLDTDSCVRLTENRSMEGGTEVLREGIGRARLENYMSPIRAEYAAQISAACGEIGALRAIPVAALNLTVKKTPKIYVWYFATSGVGNCGLSGLNLTGLASSGDGKVFVPEPGATWGPLPVNQCTAAETLTNEPRFMLGAVQEGDYVYTYWSKGYRQHFVYVARVRTQQVADPYKYEFLVSTQGGDVWRKPTAPNKFVRNAKNIFGTPAEGDHGVGEFSIQRNPYVGGYVATYFGIRGAGSPERPLEGSGYFLRVGQRPWGPFPLRQAFQLTNPYEKDWRRKIGGICFDQRFNGNYGMYTHPRLTSTSGRDIFFVISSWGHYNTFLLKLRLDTGMQDFFGAARSYPIRVYASGTPAGSPAVYPRMKLIIDGRVVGDWVVTGQLSEYAYDHPTPVPLSSIRIAYVNDNVIAGQDRNLRVDRITVGGATVQTESPTVRSTGTFSSLNQCGPGYKTDEWLHCNGEFQFHE